MDFRGMKRKELQALCKQHGVPANLTNREMVDRLSLLYKEKEKPGPPGRSCLKNLDEMDCLNDSDAVTCKAKRVRFSPENETFEFEGSDMDKENTPARTRAARAARRSRGRLAKEKVSAVSANAGNSEDSPKRNTRYQAQKVIEGPVVKASPSPALVRHKKAKKGTKIKCTVSEIVDRSTELAPMLEMEDNAFGKENGRPIRRHLRSREVVVENASELGNEAAIIPRKNPVQTRSKKMIPKDSNKVLTTYEISKDTISAGEDEIFETGKALRKSKRKASGDGKCELLGGELEKRRKIVGRITRSRAQLVGQEASAVEGDKETGDEYELQVSKDSEPVLQLEEPSKFLARKTSRQKSVVSQTDTSVRNKSRKQCKDTRLEGEASETEVGSKEKEKLSLPYGPLRRSRRNASVFNSTISPDEELATHEAVGRNHQLKHLEEPPTEKAASKPEASAEILKENEKVSQHNGPLRRSRRNTSVLQSTVSPDEELATHEAVGRYHRLKPLEEPITEKAASKPEASTELLEENEKVSQHNGPLRRSRRNTSVFKSTVSPDEELATHEAVERNHQFKHSGITEKAASKPDASTEILEENEKVSQHNGPLRRSRRNTSVFKSTVSPDEELATHEAVGRNHQFKHSGITEKAASKPDASTEILEENEKVSQHNGPLRRSRRNTSTKSSAPAADGNLVADNIVGRNEHSKHLRESTSEKEASATEAHLRRSKRNVSRHDSVYASTLMDSIPDATEKNEAQKRRLLLILEEETSAIENEPLIDELPSQSKYNASKCNIVGPARVAGKVMGKKKQRRRSKFPSSKGQAPLTESMLDIEETPTINVELSKPEAAGSKSQVRIHQEGTPEDPSKRRKSSRKISCAKKKQHELLEVRPVISDLEEVEDCTTVNFEDIPSRSGAAVEEDVAENLTTVNLEDILSQSAVAVEEDISMENVKENLVQDNVNEGNKVDEESQFQNMRRDIDYDNSVEPQEEQYSGKVSNKLVPPVSGSSSVHQPDYAGSSAYHENLRRELETEEELFAGKHKDSTSNILADLAAEDDKPSVEKERKSRLGEMYGAEFTENDVVSHVETAEIAAEKVTEIQLDSSGQWSTEETPLKILLTSECQTSAVMDDKVASSCLHTVSADNGSQEEGYQLDAQLAALSPVLGRRNPNHAEEEKSNSYETGIMDGTTRRGESFVSDASEQKEHPVFDELDGQISGKKESVVSKATTSFSMEVKETDVSHLDLLFETTSVTVEKSTPSCEHTHLRDKREEDQDPMEKDEESTHVTKMASTTISAGKTSSNNLGSVKLHHEKSQEDAGAGKKDREGISNMSNPLLDADADIYNEASKGNLDAEFTGLDGCAYPFSDKFPKDDHATVDTVSGGSHVHSGIDSQEGRGTNVDEASVEEITPAILGVIAETRDFEEGVKILEFSAESQLTPGSTEGDMEKEIHFAEITQCSDGWGSYPPLSHVNSLKHQVSGHGHKEMSLSAQSPHIPKQEGNQLETSSVNEVLSQQTSDDSAGVKSFTEEAIPMSSSPWFLEKLYGKEEEDSEMNCNAHTAAHEAFSKQSVVTLEGIDSKGIEDHACVNHSNSDAKKGSEEVLPEIEIGSVHNHHHVVVEQVSHNVDTSPAGSNCKDNKTSDEATAGYSSVVNVSLVAGEKLSEFLPGIELGDGQELNAQENINFDASLDEITCKESEALEKTASGIKESAVEGIEEFNMLEEVSGETSVPVSQTEVNTQVLDQRVEFIKMNASAQVALVETAQEDAEVPTEIFGEASKKTILLPMEADSDCYETKDVVMEAKNEISLQHDELKSIDLDIHDAKDKSIFINSDQYIPAYRETTDEIGHSRSLEGKCNFEGDSSNSKHTGVSASPLISPKGFDDQVEDEEVAHMHDSDHYCLSLDLLHNNSRIAATETHKAIGETVMPKAENGEAFTHISSKFPNSAALDATQAVYQADENLDIKSDGGVEMIWQEDEVKCGEIDGCREEVLPEADQRSLIVPHEFTSTDGANGTMAENSHFEDVNFDSMNQEDVNSSKVTAADCDDLLEEKCADVEKHNGEDVLLDLNCRDIRGAAEQVVEDCIVGEIGSDDRNGGTAWAEIAQTSPCKIDDSNISSSEAERDSISANVSQLSVSWQRGEYESNVCCTEDSRDTEIKELIEVVPNDEINDTNEATICSTAWVNFYEDKGDTFSFVNESSKDTYMMNEGGTGAENSAGKTEKTETMNCFSVVSPLNDYVDEALEHRTLVCNTEGTNSVSRDGRGDEDQNSTFRTSETNSTFEDSQDNTEINENIICTEQIAKELGKHDHHMVEVEVAELNGNQLAAPIEPVFEDGSTLRDQKMAVTTTMKEEVDSENDVNKLAFFTEPVIEDNTLSDQTMATTTMKEEVDCENDANDLAIIPTEPAFEDDGTLGDQEMAMKEEVDCENDVNKIDRDDVQNLADIFETNDSGHATSDEHTEEVASWKLLTRLEDTADDSSLTHHIRANSSPAPSETASHEFTDREINLFSHDPFNRGDERVATGSGRHGETDAAVEEKEAGQSPAVADSAQCKALAAEDVQTVEKKSWEEINQLSSQRWNSSMTTRKNMKSSSSSMFHRTPNNFFKAFDMKENTPNIKMEKTGNLTTMKSGTKRKALEDLQKN